MFISVINTRPHSTSVGCWSDADRNLAAAAEADDLLDANLSELVRRI